MFLVVYNNAILSRIKTTCQGILCQWAGSPSGKDLGLVPPRSAFESPPAHQHLYGEVGHEASPANFKFATPDRDLRVRLPPSPLHTNSIRTHSANMIATSIILTPGNV